MSITLTTLTDPEEMDIDVDVHNFEQDFLELRDDDGGLILMTREQLMQLVSWAIKARWIDSIPM